MDITTNPAVVDYFAQYQSTPPASKRQQKIIVERLRQGKPPLIDTSGMTREERNAVPPELRRPQRGLGRHWEEHTFRAIFAGFSYQYDPKTIERKRYLVLTDVYMDGSLLTLNWRVPALPGLGGMCDTEGKAIEFDAWFARTGKAAREAGQPVLRGPFKKVR